MLTAGTALGPYRILARLGSGGMGVVYRAHDARLGRDVAIKVITADLSDQRDSLRRFEQEARAAGALNDPHVCTILDVGNHDGSPFVVMELLDGESLRARIAEGPIPPRKAIDWAAQAARGLAAAHEKGIIHRDIKPENLFLTRDGRVKVMDFGLAKLTRPAASAPAGVDAATISMTTNGTVLGTAGYMAPEQVRAEPVDHRADLFALGAVLHELLTGTRAFAGGTLVEASCRILNADPPPLGAPGRELPSGLEAIVARCLEKNPNERFQCAKDLAFALGNLGQAVPRAGDTTAAAGGTRGSRFRRSGLLVAAAALATLSVIAGHALWRPAPPEPVSYQRLTFRRGAIGNARFAPDGLTVVLDASWDGPRSGIYTLRAGHPESRSFGLTDATLFDVSARGELAVKVRQPGSYSLVRGRLARVSLGGGEPRLLRDDVVAADWSPDGSELAVAVADSAGVQLQLPAGTTVARSQFFRGSPRVAAGGREVAFAYGDSLAVAGPGPSRRVLGAIRGDFEGLAWHPRTRELWYAEADTTGSTWLRAVSRGGVQRTLLHLAGTAGLEDIAEDGRLLLAMRSARSAVMAGTVGQSRERDLSWLDFSLASCLSPDGSLLVFDEAGTGGGGAGGVYLRPTDGSPPVRLGDGTNGALSPDRQSVAVYAGGSLPRLRVLPVGAGSPRDVATGGITPGGAQWYFPDGRRLLFLGRRGDSPPQLFAVPVEGGEPQPQTPPGWVNLGRAQVLSPDGRQIAACDNRMETRIFAVDGAAPRPVPGLGSTEYVMGWTEDSRGLYVFQRTDVPARVYRVDVASGRRELWCSLWPDDGIGVAAIWQIILTPDGRSYVYNFRRVQTDLYLVTGVR